MMKKALLIGVNKYPNMTGDQGEVLHLGTVGKLLGPNRDAQTLADRIKEYANGEFDITVMPHISGDKCHADPEGKLNTADAKKAILELFWVTEDADGNIQALQETNETPKTALFFFLGHGEPNQEGTKLISLLFSDYPNPGLLITWFTKVLLKSPVKNQIIWLGCCHSGGLLEFDFAELQQREYNQIHGRSLIAACEGSQVSAIVSGQSIFVQELLAVIDPETVVKKDKITSLLIEKHIKTKKNEDVEKQRERCKLDQNVVVNHSGEVIDLWEGTKEGDLPTDDLIWWQNKCETRIREKEQLTIKTSTAYAVEQIVGMSHRVDDVFVPLGLFEFKKDKQKVEPKKKGQDQKSEQSQSEEIQEIEIEQKQEFDYVKFFKDVIEDKNTPKSKGQRLAIVGEPGAGKTTILQRIAIDITKSESLKEIMVIWLSFRDVGEQNMVDYLLNTWLLGVARLAGQETVSDQMKKDFETKCKEGKVLLLLDGMDEVSTAAPLQNIEKEINSKQWEKMRILLTCRSNLWDGSNYGVLSNFDTYRTLEFDGDRIQKFMEKWFVKTQKQDGNESLWEALNQPDNSQIKDLVKNPLRLTLLCLIWYQQGIMPETQAGLYKEFVRLFYQWKRKLDDEKQQNELTQALGELSKQAIEKTGESRTNLDAKFVLGILGEKNFELAKNMGWLNQVGGSADNAVYSFFHPTFQEYFAALAVDNWNYFFDHVADDPTKGVYRVFQPDWKQVMLLWMGRDDIDKNLKEGFISALVNFDDRCGEWNYKKVEVDRSVYFFARDTNINVDKGFYEYRAYFMSAILIREFKQRDLGNEIVEQVVKWAFDNNFANEIENTARSVLEETIREKVIECLVQVIYNARYEYTRWLAAVSLRKIDVINPIASKVLDRVSKNITGEDNRMRAAASLAKKIDVGNDRTIKDLVSVIIHTTHENTRWRVIESLAEMGVGNENAIACLVSLIENTTNESTRWLAAECLAKIGVRNPQAIGCLVSVIKNTRNENTRWQAAKCLAKIDVGNEDAIAGLVSVIKNTTDEFTRWLAAETLAQINEGNPQAIAGLVSVIDNNATDEYTRWQAAETLAQINVGNKKAIAYLVSVIKNTGNEDTRWQAATSLGKIDEGNPDATAGLVSVIIHTTNEYNRRKAAESLGKIITTTKNYQMLVTQLKTSLNNETYKNKYDLYQTSYTLIWKCAQNLTYPQFSQAWHDGIIDN